MSEKSQVNSEVWEKTCLTRYEIRSQDVPNEVACANFHMKVSHETMGFIDMRTKAERREALGSLY